MNKALPLILIALLAAPALAQPAPGLEAVTVNGVELHYQELGDGEPVVLVHGTFGDYRTWLTTAAPLAQKYRVINYSRRYNFPNENPDIVPDFSARTEANDLKALIEKLDLAPAHVVGHSYGAFTALLLALEHPDLVKSLTLGEPPLMPWLADISEGAELWESFQSGVMNACKTAIQEGDPDRAKKIFFDWVIGPGEFETLPPMVQNVLNSNVTEFAALVTSTEPFPVPSREAVREFNIPTLMLTGADTVRELYLIDNELERTLPDVKRVLIPGASHAMFFDKPMECNQAILEFLKKK